MKKAATKKVVKPAKTGDKSVSAKGASKTKKAVDDPEVDLKTVAAAIEGLRKAADKLTIEDSDDLDLLDDDGDDDGDSDDESSGLIDSAITSRKSGAKHSKVAKEEADDEEEDEEEEADDEEEDEEEEADDEEEDEEEEAPEKSSVSTKHVVRALAAMEANVNALSAKVEKMQTTIKAGKPQFNTQRTTKLVEAFRTIQSLLEDIDPNLTTKSTTKPTKKSVSEGDSQTSQLIAAVIESMKPLQAQIRSIEKTVANAQGRSRSEDQDDTDDGEEATKKSRGIWGGRILG